MIFLYLIIAILVCGIIVWLVLSKRKFDTNLKLISDQNLYNFEINPNITEEFDKLKSFPIIYKNTEAKIDRLRVPTIDSIPNSSSLQTKLKKLSDFSENYNKSFITAEQFILSVLPTSQIGESLHSIAQTLPPDLGHQLLGDFLEPIKEGLHPESFNSFFQTFIHGMHNTDTFHGMTEALREHNVIGLIKKPIVNGLKEALGVNEGLHNVTTSMHNISTDMISNANEVVDIEGLTDFSDFDTSGHFPVMTVFFSSFREIGLLCEDKTDWITSIKNISLDAAGTGVGAVGGAKVGAAIGTFFCPGIGTAIGGLIGSIGGGIAGRKVTNNIKMKPLKEAIANYESNSKQMKYESQREVDNTLDIIRSNSTKNNEELKQHIEKLKPELLDHQTVLVNMAEGLKGYFTQESLYMQKIRDELSSSIWFSNKKHQELLDGFDNQLNEYTQKLNSISYNADPQNIILTLIHISILGEDIFSRLQPQVEYCIDNITKLNNQNNNNILLWTYSSNKVHNHFLAKTSEYSSQKINSLSSFLKQWNNKMELLERTVTREKEKLGLK